jgi:hypothetical protein
MGAWKDPLGETGLTTALRLPHRLTTGGISLPAISGAACAPCFNRRIDSATVFAKATDPACMTRHR